MTLGLSCIGLHSIFLDQSICQAALHHIQLVLTLSIRLHFFPSLPIPFHSITLQDLDRTVSPARVINWVRRSGCKRSEDILTKEEDAAEEKKYTF